MLYSTKQPLLAEIADFGYVTGFCGALRSRSCLVFPSSWQRARSPDGGRLPTTTPNGACSPAWRLVSWVSSWSRAHGASWLIGPWLSTRAELARATPASLAATAARRATVPACGGNPAEPIAADRLLHAMGSDKKNRGARLRFALPRALGDMDARNGWTREAPETAIRQALEAIV